MDGGRQTVDSGQWTADGGWQTVVESEIGNPQSEIKACCAAVYESDWARLLLGESFHPGGLALTERIGRLLQLGPEHTVLDVASGRGESGRFLAERFGCRVVGLEFGKTAVAEANAATADMNLAHLVQFHQGDAEQIPFPAGSFDAVLCECAFCTFPNKPTAAAELARVLKPGGRLGLSDLTRQGALPSELETLLAWVACIADARPVAEYVAYLETAGFTMQAVEEHDAVLAQTVREVRTRLLGAELLVKLKKIDFPNADFTQAKAIARSAATAIEQGKLGYAVLIAEGDAD